MRISSFAEKVGVHPSTIRRYEKAGLFHARRDRQGHRRFGDEDVERFRRIFLPEEFAAEGARP